MRRARRGFTLFELAVVTCIVALLMSFGLDRLLRYQELAERAAMENAVSVMRSALGLRFASLYLDGKDHAIEHLAEENPMDWLADRPPNYLGALWAPALDTLPAGSWYYDRSIRMLIYYPDRKRYLAVPASGDPRIRFRVIVDFSAGSGSSQRSLNRLAIEPARTYSWFANAG